MNKNRLELTDDEILYLRMYLLLSTTYRESEQKACEELSIELKEDGTNRYPNMQGNVRFWKQANQTLEKILNKL